MRSALVDGRLREAKPGLKGTCRGCGAPMVARCGEIRVPHWAHIGRRACDNRWETEGPWHRSWKMLFPNECQEQVDRDDDGQRHVADLKSEHGLVVEFQHSRIDPKERRAREAFYNPMFWVIDGLRRKRDWADFAVAIREHGRVIFDKPLIKSVPADMGALLRDWSDSRVPVLFDFGEPVLWLLFPIKLEGRALVSTVRRDAFIRALLNGSHTNIINWSMMLARLGAVLPRRRATGISALPHRMPRRRRSRRRETFQQYGAHNERKRRRM